MNKPEEFTVRKATRCVSVPLFAIGLLLAGIAIVEPVGAAIVFNTFVPREWMYPMVEGAESKTSGIGLGFTFTAILFEIALAGAAIASFVNAFDEVVEMVRVDKDGEIIRK